MKKLLIALILILVAAAGTYAYFKYTKTDDKASVTQQAITQGNIVQQVQATGTLEAWRNVQVGSQVSGIVKSLHADFNSIVKKDQIIAELDPTLLQVQVLVQEANIQRQQGDIAQQEVQLENDRLNEKRALAQFDAKLISAQQKETAQLQVKTRQAQIESAKKQIIQSEAQLAQAKLNVSYCTIRSPIDGVVVNRIVDIGQTVQASMQTPQFFTIATDLTTLRLSAGVDEADIGYIRRGMPVSFNVDSYQGQTFTGTVDAVRLNAQTQNNVVTYPVWINVDNGDLKLRPSMTASLRIIVDQANNVLKVPNQALRFRPTSDMYTWLGLTPPAVGRGRAAVTADAGKGGDAPAKGDVVGKAGDPAAKGDMANAGGGNQRRQKGAQGGGGGDQSAALREAAGSGAQGGGDQAGFGRRGQGGQGGQGRGQQGGQPGGGGGQNRQFGGQNADGSARGGRGQGGFGRGGNMTPEQMAEFQQRFGGAGGRGGRGGQGGQGGGRGQGGQGGGRLVGNAPQAEATPLAERNAEKIDDLFQAVPKRIQPGMVWLYDEKATDPAKKLRQISVRLGLTDNATSEMVSSGEPLPVGTMVVTNVVPPPSALPKAGPSSIFQQQRGFGPGGGGDRQPQPGGGGPGGGGGGGRGGGGRGGN